MRKNAMKGASVGLAFSGLAFFSIRFLGFNSTSLSLTMYLYVLLGVALYLREDLKRIIRQNPLTRVVVILEGEELRMKKLLTGETYRIDGEVEKL